MNTLYKKELRYYLNNPLGYIIIVLFAVFANFFYIKDIFSIGQVSVKMFLGILPWLMLVFIPAISMRSISEERKNNTLEVLLSLPVSESEIILSKFLALLTILGMGLLLTAGLPVGLFFISGLYLPELLIGYIGLILMGGMFIALSMFFSAQTKNQVVALLLSVLVLFFFLILYSDFISGVLSKSMQDALVYFSPIYHLNNFIKGILDIRSVFYFLAGIAAFLTITIVDLEKKS